MSKEHPWRSVYCETWRDREVRALSPAGKLAFLYLITCEQARNCGAFVVYPDEIAAATGLPHEGVRDIMEGLAPLVDWWPETDHVFIHNFYRRQSWDRENPNFRVSAIKSLEGLPPAVRDAVVGRYPELGVDRATVPTSNRKERAAGGEQSPHQALSDPYPTPPIALSKPSPSPAEGLPKPSIAPPHPIPSTQTQPEPTPTPKTRASVPAPVVMAMRADFNRFMEEYPEERKTDPVAAWNAWQQVASAGEIPSVEDVLAGLATYKKTDEYQRGVILGAPKFILQKRWKRPGVVATPKVGRTFGGDAPNLPGRPAI